MSNPALPFPLFAQIAVAVAVIAVGVLIFWLFRRKKGRGGATREPEAKGGGIVWVVTRLAIAILVAGLIVRFKDPLEGLFPWIPQWIGQDVLAFLAITFAVVQFLDARDEEKGMKNIEGRIQRLLNDATTRSIGAFPTNLENIIEMIGTAKSSIRIIVDFPSYGIYSDPGRYRKYLEALKDLAANSQVEFKMLSYDETLTLEDTMHEFPAMPTVADPKFASFVKDLAADKVPINVHDLAKHLQARQSEGIGTLEKAINHNRGLQRRYLSERAPLFLWIIDDREAVFTFKNLDRNSETYSIRSCDDELVEHFVGYFNLAFDHGHRNFERDPTYKLQNMSGPLEDGKEVTLTGKYNSADQTINVTKVMAAGSGK